jgi:hypothetical protein
LKLSRKTTIKIKENDEEREFEINFDDLKEGRFLGRGQFGTVKTMYHAPSKQTFAVKVLYQFYLNKFYKIIIYIIN